VYKVLEPYLEDKRKLRRRRKEGYSLTYMDEFVDELLTKDRVCATSLWKLPPRQVLEDEGRLEERVSPLQAELDEELEREEQNHNEDDEMEVEEVRNGRGSTSEDGRSASGRSESEDESE
jgi:pre-mRNA-splicing factor 38A